MTFGRQSFKIVAFFSFWGFFASLTGCARYAVKLDLPEVSQKVEAIVPQRLSRVLSQLEGHLQERGLTYKLHRKKNLVDIEVDWVKSLSLNYYYMSFGPRKRHMAHWKSVWRLAYSGARKTRVVVENMELVYLGPQSETPAEALADGNWAASPDAHRRAHMELHRFLASHYASHPYLASFTPVRLDPSPLGTRVFRDLTLQSAPRTSPF